MTRGGFWPALALAALAVLSAGCSSLPFFGDDDDKAAAAEPRPEPLVALYDVDVDAPGELKTLLERNLDLVRFREAPVGDAISGSELDRLAAAMPAQARALLETEGYFNAEVAVERVAGGERPKLKVTVVPGPRVVVAAVGIDSTVAQMGPRSIGRVPPGEDRLVVVRRSWPLRPGFPFRQDAWSAAKVATLNQLRTDGYPTAGWRETHARIDAIDNKADLSLVIDPGPQFLLGKVTVEGLERYDAESVLRLATFQPGTVYSEQVLLDWQERLLKVGLFEGAVAEIDPDPAKAAETAVTVKVKEMTQRQATFGIGYSANTGQRVSVEYFDRKLFGQRLISRSKVEYGADLKTVGAELTTWPLEDGWRHLLTGSLERLNSVDEVRNSWTARIGRTRETTRIDRLYSLDATRADLKNDGYHVDATALLGNWAWLRRDLDNNLSPTEGTTISTQAGLGAGRGTRVIGESEQQKRRGPLARAYARLYWFQPFGGWAGTARLEAGEVFTKSIVSVPDTLLFRAGGDGSVRGYGFRSLGPDINGEVASGRVLATGSVEMAHVILDSLPALQGAVFVDAGNAAIRWTDYVPRFGYGVGLRYKSPVGPIRVDVAYGQHVKTTRVHFNVGVTF